LIVKLLKKSMKIIIILKSFPASNQQCSKAVTILRSCNPFGANPDRTDMEMRTSKKKTLKSKIKKLSAKSMIIKAKATPKAKMAKFGPVLRKAVKFAKVGTQTE